MVYNKDSIFDFLIIGSGIAGLSTALEASKTGTVCVLSKRALDVGSTSWAQGGIAAVSEKDDSHDLHIKDTLIAGDGLCSEEIVEIVVKEGPERLKELIALGTNFDKSGGDFHLHQEGGHSKRRIYHAADATGAEIQRALIAAVRNNKKITLIEDATAIDLITHWKLPNASRKTGPNKVYGAYVLLNNGEIAAIAARTTILATGGSGKAYLYTSNPDIATGDGIAMAYRAGCRVANLEFYQFHPTCLYNPKAKSFLITEAMRGEGAILRRQNGEPFMAKYDVRAELAPRDIVARAIDFEIKKSGEDCVLLDITHKSSDFIKDHFPTIYDKCLTYGIDITTTPIPVVPAAHYQCGGVVTDSMGHTDIENLYAVGEVANTGLHGANRLASNSLLEGLVFGYRAAMDAASKLNRKNKMPEFPEWDQGAATDSDEQVVITQNWDEIRRFMWNYVGIVRSTKRLQRALHRAAFIRKEVKDYYWNFKISRDLIELRNLDLVAELMIRSALKRKESRGLHYTIDYPERDDAYLLDTVIRPGEAG